MLGVSVDCSTPLGLFGVVGVYTPDFIRGYCCSTTLWSWGGGEVSNASLTRGEVGI